MKILQFGTGRFLRGFFCPIITEPKCITVVQSRTNSDGAKLINSQPDGFHVWTRGIQNGKQIDKHELVTSIDRAVVAADDWSQILELGLHVELIVSNTTAAGLALDSLDDGCDFLATCPSSYPAKIAAILFQRFKNQLPGLTVLPLELVEYNGSKLLQLVKEQSTSWEATNKPEFLAWLASENRWLNNLVDRIVVSPSDTPPWPDQDDMAVVGEPFKTLIIKNDGKGESPIPQHEMVKWTDNLDRYFLRKVRILNGLHTAMVAKFLPEGIETVLECVTRPESRNWIEELLNEEILPTLKSKGLDEREFADDVLERFENPFFRHFLKDIANGHSSKLPVRIQPTVDEFQTAFGRPPEKLTEVLNIQLPTTV